MTDLPVPALEELYRRRSVKWQTYPPEVLPLTLAEMDFALAPPITAVLREAVERSDLGYAMPEPVSGPGLGEAFAGFAARRWGWEVDPGRVTPVFDVGVGVVELLRRLVRPGDTVVFCPPVYSPFFGWVPEAGGNIHEVPLAHDELGYRLDLAALESAFARHPAAFVLCNPHNPVGRVHTRQELEQLVDLARRYRVTIVSDEIHAPLALPGATYTPLLTVEGASEVAVAVTSASKAFNLAGLKCAVVVTGSAEGEKLTDGFPPDTRWRVGHLGVLAAVAAFTDGDAWLDQLLHTLDARRAQLGELIDQRLPGVRWHPPEATFLAWLDCTPYGADDAPRELLLRHAVAVDAGPRYGAAGSGFVRLNFATGPEILDEATNRMAKAFSAGGRT